MQRKNNQNDDDDEDPPTRNPTRASSVEMNINYLEENAHNIQDPVKYAQTIAAVNQRLPRRTANNLLISYVDNLRGYLRVEEQRLRVEQETLDRRMELMNADNQSARAAETQYEVDVELDAHAEARAIIRETERIMSTFYNEPLRRGAGGDNNSNFSESLAQRRSKRLADELKRANEEAEAAKKLAMRGARTTSPDPVDPRSRVRPRYTESEQAAIDADEARHLSEVRRINEIFSLERVNEAKARQEKERQIHLKNKQRLELQQQQQLESQRHAEAIAREEAETARKAALREEEKKERARQKKLETELNRKNEKEKQAAHRKAVKAGKEELKESMRRHRNLVDIENSKQIARRAQEIQQQQQQQAEVNIPIDPFRFPTPPTTPTPTPTPPPKPQPAVTRGPGIKQIDSMKILQNMENQREQELREAERNGNDDDDDDDQLDFTEEQWANLKEGAALVGQIDAIDRELRRARSMQNRDEIRRLTERRGELTKKKFLLDFPEFQNFDFPKYQQQQQAAVAIPDEEEKSQSIDALDWILNPPTVPVNNNNPPTSSAPEMNNLRHQQGMEMMSMMGQAPVAAPVNFHDPILYHLLRRPGETTQQFDDRRVRRDWNADEIILHDLYDHFYYEDDEPAEEFKERMLREGKLIRRVNPQQQPRAQQQLPQQQQQQNYRPDYLPVSSKSPSRSNTNQRRNTHLSPKYFFDRKQREPRGNIRMGTDGRGALKQLKCWTFTFRLTDHPGFLNTIIFNDQMELLRGSYIIPPLPIINRDIPEDANVQLDFISYQLELGMHGTLNNNFHYQGYVEFSDRVSALQVVEYLGWTDQNSSDIWLAPRKSNQKEAIEYTQKEHTCVRIVPEHLVHRNDDYAITNWDELPFIPTWRVMEGAKHNEGSANASASIRFLVQSGASYDDIAQEYPGEALRNHSGINAQIAAFRKAQPQKMRPVKTFVRWGETGTGKTTGVYAMHGLDHVYKKPLKEHWWDGYDSRQHYILLIDEFANDNNTMKIEDFLQWLDNTPLWLPQRYAGTWAAYNTVYITSNLPPSRWFPKCSPMHRRALYRRLRTGGITKLYPDTMECRRRHENEKINATMDPTDSPFDHENVVFVRPFEDGDDPLADYYEEE